MEGGGAYNKAGLNQLSIVHRTSAFLQDSVNHLAVAKQHAPLLRIADLGASQGRNSVELLATVLKQLHASLPSPLSREYLVYHEDQPGNDFESLFQTLHGPASYLDRFPNVYASVISKSFYERVLPSESVDLALSYVSLQWLSKLPTPLPGRHVTMFVPHKAPPALVHEWKTAAHNDLVRFLQLRAVELSDNGVLCTTMVSKTHSPTAELLHKAFGTWVVEAVANGLVSPTTMEAMGLPLYFRSEDEVRVATADVPELTLTALETVSLEMPFEDVAAVANFFSVIMKSALMAHLTDDERANMALHNALEASLLRHFDVLVDVHGVMQPLYKSVTIDYIYAAWTRRSRN
ncbi:hypothetical protein SPRG_05576 [Saprolegnia parasitica CBS 223.65]|uniref:S-adenosyl-L-methionine-dependent methyltransferase n=1 Tax=Saprolegnia parasitica (strain CBS 223.65) TaxID=695850 RepID=A0A067CGJ9_SAPPC|nr:hypothetical protein SPRG_05576 [Saprolegnia parasitica CBS 223.65]KDO29623.1 hypothetical protein SPRG_05576 [Saprolegnia parasitica CBS 223.65]|eukprot:XP_012199683.1 hypothetical protein SPRG_05576 [Saprolegnia parasitica CBS 223.65]